MLAGNHVSSPAGCPARGYRGPLKYSVQAAPRAGFDDDHVRSAEASVLKLRFLRDRMIAEAYLSPFAQVLITFKPGRIFAAPQHSPDLCGIAVAVKDAPWIMAGAQKLAVLRTE